MIYIVWLQSTRTPKYKTMSSDNSTMTMEFFSGTAEYLVKQIIEYFNKKRIAPGLIQSVSITPDPYIAGVITSATVTILHRENSTPNQKISPCTPVVIFDENVAIFCKKVQDTHHGTSLRPWFHDQNRSANGTHMRIDIFAV